MLSQDLQATLERARLEYRTADGVINELVSVSEVEAQRYRDIRRRMERVREAESQKRTELANLQRNIQTLTEQAGDAARKARHATEQIRQQQARKERLKALIARLEQASDVRGR